LLSVVKSREGVLCDEITALGAIVPEKSSIHLVSVMRKAVRKGGWIEIILFIFKVVRASVNLHASLNVLGICQSCDFSMLCLHGKYFSHSSLAIVQTLLKISSLFHGPTFTVLLIFNPLQLFLNIEVFRKTLHLDTPLLILE